MAASTARCFRPSYLVTLVNMASVQNASNVRENESHWNLDDLLRPSRKDYKLAFCSCRGECGGGPLHRVLCVKAGYRALQEANHVLATGDTHFLKKSKPAQVLFEKGTGICEMCPT